MSVVGTDRSRHLQEVLCRYLCGMSSDSYRVFVTGVPDYARRRVRYRDVRAPLWAPGVLSD
jgi:hypothetical protein